ncbi:MAG TPA: hypothetical protein VN515_07790 [Terriglobales bacterium]|nr:hypothetical protein [Terriglobales bacterium]
MRRFALSVLLVGLLAMAAAAQQTEVVVTTLPDHGDALPAIAASQVTVRQGHAQDPVTGWQACTGANGKLELALMIDDDTRGLNSSMGDLKDFIQNLPPTTLIALVYMNASTVQIAQGPTADHALAISKLRPPKGSSPSPYGSLEALLDRWKSHAGMRREIIMISDGQEHAGGNDSNNITLKQAVAEAVASGVVVYAIAAGQAAGPSSAPALQPDPSGAGASPSVFGSGDQMDSGALGHPFGAAGRAQTNLGSAQVATNNGLQSLSELAKATGGEVFSEGNGVTPSRLTPYLAQIEQRLRSQYLLAFTPAPGGGKMQGLRIEISGAGAKVVAPTAVIAPKK